MDVIARVALGLQLDNQTAESGESEFSTVAKQILDVKITNPIIICAGKKSVLTFDTMKTESCPDANFVVTDDDIRSGVEEPGHHQWLQSWYHDDSQFSMTKYVDLWEWKMHLRS